MRLQDIVESVDAIQQFTNGLTEEDFRSNPMVVAAVESKLRLVSEAAIRLGDNGPILCPGLPWRDIRGIGNRLRHEYHRVDVGTVWDTVMIDLPPLKDPAQRAILSIEGNS